MNESLLEEPLTVDANDSLSKAFGQLQKRKDDYFVVLDGKTYAGVVDSRVLRDFFSDPSKTKAKTVVVHPPTLSEDESDEEIVRKLLATRHKVLPVLDKNDRVVGVVPRWKALSLLRQSPHLHGKKVSDLMSKDPVSVPESATIAQARHAMKEEHVFRLVVVDSKKRPVGVLSAFDLATRVQADPKDARRQYFYFPTPSIRVDEEPVQSVMSSPVLSVSPDLPVMEAVELLSKRNFSSLVVQSGETLSGILTQRDLFNACVVPEKANIRFLGLTGEEHIFKASLESLAAKYWDKLEARVDLQPDDELVVSIKSKHREGKKREYLVSSRLTVKGRVYAMNPKDTQEHFKNWDLQQAVKESLEALIRTVLR
ncbi:CBS domain-containing protein [Candidatus Micrarchaeota archaeon]|nr:CBS domain-containing protein [Candidatus Micrarchaeota archaeon]